MAGAAAATETAKKYTIAVLHIHAYTVIQQPGYQFLLIGLEKVALELNLTKCKCSLHCWCVEASTAGHGWRFRLIDFNQSYHYQTVQTACVESHIFLYRISHIYYIVKFAL